jgi:hypothetical protein
MRRLQQLLAIALTLPLAGCLVAADLYVLAAERPAQSTLNEMARMCRADAGLRLFGPTPAGIELWIPGRLTREPVEGDDLHGVTPTEAWWNTDEPFLRRGIARAVYENIAPSTTWPAVYRGPKRGDPHGLYKFELAPPEDPRCVADRKMEADWLKNSRPTPNPQPDPPCIVWTHVGPFDYRPHPNTFIRFDDEALQAKGIWRRGEVLFVDGKRRASFFGYQAKKPGSASGEFGSWQTPACEKPSKQLPDGL